MEGESQYPTPWAVRCCCSPTLVYLTEDEYLSQLSRPDNRWSCPRCGKTAKWDDDNYEAYQEVEEDDIPLDGPSDIDF